MEEPRELPSSLGILPFRNKVLLPGAITRIRCSSPDSVKLVEKELWHREQQGVIGVLPVGDADAAETALGGSLLSAEYWQLSLGTAGHHETLDSHNLAQESIYWHNRGVAARALHLSRGVEKPSGKVTYNVVLEGICRFNVRELSNKGAYRVARVERSDLTKSELELAEQDPDLIMLSRQFKATATQLIAVLEQKLKSISRSKILLETLPVHRLADIFVASFEISFEEQLFMLDTVDFRKRLIKATQLVGRHLQVVRVAEKVTRRVEEQLSRSQKELLLREQIKAIKDELGDTDDDEDGVAALEKKMQRVGMPPNVLKHAQRELRQMRKMQPHQPGYNSSRMYLELLADLPWKKACEEHELDLKLAKEAKTSCQRSNFVFCWTSWCREDFSGIIHCFCFK